MRWIYYWLHFVDEKLQLREDKPSQVLITVNDRTEICIQDFWCPIHFPFHAPWNDGWNWIKSNRHAFMPPLKHLSTHSCLHPPSTHQSIHPFIPFLDSFGEYSEMRKCTLSYWLLFCVTPLCDLEQVSLTIWASDFSLENTRTGLD